MPQKVKGAMIVGAKGGSGVLLSRDSVTGSWNGPAFYILGGVSYGLQAGGAVSEVILLIMTDKGGLRSWPAASNSALTSVSPLVLWGRSQSISAVGCCC